MENTKWTKEEDNILIKNYTIYGIPGCLDKLDRSRRAIQLRRKQLDIPKTSPVKDRWRKEKVEKVVKNSICYYDCLDKLGINNKGSSYNTLKKYIKLYNLDISHFDKNHNIKKINKNKIIPLDEILIKNSTYTNRSSLKKRLYKEGIKERICELCGQTEEWKGKKMTLILDHINGVNNDNRKENLQIVCPNCNATLPTHCKGNKRLYEEKENLRKKEIQKKLNKQKFKEYHFKRRKVERPPYEQLMKEIEETNYCAVGRKYGVSDNSIRKWVKNYKKTNTK